MESDRESFFNKVKNSVQASLPAVSFIDWERTYALFCIRKSNLPDGSTLKSIIVAHEGDWTSEDAMLCHREFRNYEDVQSEMGENLIFERKQYVELLDRTLIEYTFSGNAKAILAVPATGESIAFEIYGRGTGGACHLLEYREL